MPGGHYEPFLDGHEQAVAAELSFLRRHRRDAPDRLQGLTEREREVLVEIGLGRANSEIATRLHMSEATVKTHVSHLFDKLAATNRVQLAIAAFRADLVD
jgi:DNA-binding NarL/FixJ family response regulator